MSKDYDSLQVSRNIRQYLIGKWGRVPTSIWDVDWSLKYLEFSKSYGEQQAVNARSVGKTFQLSGVGARHGQLSRFPQDILRFMVKFLTPEKIDEPGYFKNYLPTVIDPFAGHNSRGEGCWRCNRNYIGWDISERHNVMNQKALNILTEENNNSMFKREAILQFVSGDSRNINYQNQFDFSITSPPFYDIEFYGDEPGQLGKAPTYDEFIHQITQIFKNVFIALKDNTFCVAETNDFRRNSEFHVYHSDVIQLLKSVGFKMHDIVICNYGSGFLEVFLSDVESQKIVSKNHSYFLVATKNFKRLGKRQDVRTRLENEMSRSEPQIKQQVLL